MPTKRRFLSLRRSEATSKRWRDIDEAPCHYVEIASPARAGSQ